MLLTSPLFSKQNKIDLYLLSTIFYFFSSIFTFNLLPDRKFGGIILIFGVYSSIMFLISLYLSWKTIKNK